MARKAPFLTYVYDNMDSRSHDIGYRANEGFKFDNLMHSPSYKIRAYYGENVYFDVYVLDNDNNEHFTGYIYVKNYTGMIDDIAIAVLTELSGATEKAMKDIKNGKQMYLYI